MREMEDENSPIIRSINDDFFLPQSVTKRHSSKRFQTNQYNILVENTPTPYLNKKFNSRQDRNDLADGELFGINGKAVNKIVPNTPCIPLIRNDKSTNITQNARKVREYL